MGGRHFPVSLTAHTVPKKCASPSEDGAWLASREKTLFISSRRLSFRFVVVVVRPIMKTAKRKFMFRCFFAACIRQAKRPPPSISSIFPLDAAEEKQSLRSSTLNLAACEKPYGKKSSSLVLCCDWKLISGRVIMKSSFWSHRWRSLHLRPL